MDYLLNTKIPQSIGSPVPCPFGRRNSRHLYRIHSILGVHNFSRIPYQEGRDYPGRHFFHLPIHSHFPLSSFFLIAQNRRVCGPSAERSLPEFGHPTLKALREYSQRIFLSRNYPEKVRILKCQLFHSKL